MLCGQEGGEGPIFRRWVSRALPPEWQHTGSQTGELARDSALAEMTSRGPEGTWAPTMGRAWKDAASPANGPHLRVEMMVLCHGGWHMARHLLS